MKRYGWLLFVFLAVRVDAQMNEGMLVTRNNYYELPFDDAKKPIHATAVLKGEEFDFILNSGAPVFISSEMQRKYKFRSIVRAKAKDIAGNTTDIDIVKIDTIRVGPFIFTDIPALVFDFGKSFIKCFGISGNIGSNILRHLVVQFDVQEKRIAMTDNKALLKNALPEIPLVRIDEQSNVFFTVKTDSNVSDTVHFDTGDREFYDISKRAAARYRLLHPGDIVRKGYGVTSMGIAGAGSPFHQYVMKPGNIKVGNEMIGGGLVRISGDDMSRMGRELLNYGILQINYQESMYGFQRFSNPYIAHFYDYGFEPVRDKERVMVGCIWEKTAAATAGMRRGDRLLRINGIDLTSLSMCDMDAALKMQLHRDLDSVSITYKDRKGNVKTASLPMMPLAP